MGTSSSYGGPPNKSPLVPSWVGDLGTIPADRPAVDPVPGVPPPPGTLPAAAPPPIPPNAPSDRYTAARSNFTSFAKAGGTGGGGAALRRALSSYVRGSGGRGGAASRMASSCKTASQLAGFIRSVEQGGTAYALREFKCAQLVGKPAGEAIEQLVDVFCPDGGPVDDSIARQAFQETVLDWLEKDLPSVDELSAADWREFLADFTSRSIENRIMADIGKNGIKVPADAKQALTVQRELHSVIRGCVDEAYKETGASFDGMSDSAISALMKNVYERVWEYVEELGGEE
jgi:hypothetical protein